MAVSLGMVTKQMFFDRKAILRATDRATKKVFSKFGSFVRKAAQHSMRRRKGVSEPGQPPHVHTGHLKRLIYFGYDKDRKSVVIGPLAFRIATDAPPALEYGGTVKPQRQLAANFIEGDYGPIRIGPEAKGYRWTHMVPIARGKIATINARLQTSRMVERAKRLQGEINRLRRRHSVYVRARPFMGPAFEAEKPKLPAMWADSVKG